MIFCIFKVSLLLLFQGFQGFKKKQLIFKVFKDEWFVFKDFKDLQTPCSSSFNFFSMTFSRFFSSNFCSCSYMISFVILALSSLTLIRFSQRFMSRRSRLISCCSFVSGLNKLYNNKGPKKS